MKQGINSNDFRRLLPIVNWAGNYHKKYLAGDLIAGVIVGIVLIPQSMAYAMLANLPPEVGFYSCILPILIYAVLGGSRCLAVGPVGLMSLMVGSAIAEMNLVGAQQAFTVAATLAFLVGLILLCMRAVRLGALINFISHPVISGFTSAAAIIIGLSQLKHLLGLQIPRSDYTHERIVYVIENFQDVNPYTMAISTASVGVMILLRGCAFGKLSSRLWSPGTAALLAKSGPLFVVILGTLVVWYFRFDLSTGIAIVGNIPAGLPSLSIPVADWPLWREIAATAVLVAIVGFLESVSVAKTLASRKRQKIDANQELIALGGANLGSAFSGGYPVAGGLGRSMVNYTSGANTPLASIVTVVIIIFSLMFLVPSLFFLPRCVLAAIIVVAVSGLVDVKTFRHIWLYDKAEANCLIITFFVVLAIGIELGIVIGVIISIGFHLYRSSEPHIAIVGRVEGSEHFRNVQRHKVKTSPRIILMRVDENLYFANTNFLEDKIMALVADNQQAEHLVLICSSVNMIDSSALELLDTLIGRLRQAGVTLYLAEVKGPVMDKLKNSPFLKTLGRDKVFLSTHEAVVSLEK